MSRIETPLLSIIVATYNAAAYIGPTIQSLLEQSIDPELVEIVVVDGESRDDTVERVKNSGLPVVLRSAPDDGIYDAMNTGVELARGRWVQFLNAGDTFAGHDSLRTVLAALDDRDAEGTPWAIGGAVNLQGGRGPAVPIRNMPFDRRRHLFGLQPHCHQACWFSREAFIKIGGHDLSIGLVADYDLITRFARIAPPLEIRSVVIDYLGGGVSEIPAAQIAMSLHRARVQRSGLGHVGRIADLVVTRCLGAFNASRIGLGKLRRVLRARGNVR